MANSDKPPEKAGLRKLYLVRERDWGLHGGSGADMPRGDGSVAGAFATRAAAEEFRLEREKVARRANDYWPLYYQASTLDGLLDWSHFEEPVFRDWLTDADIPLPPKREFHEHKDTWLEWLEGLGPDRLARLYEALHKFAFYEVLEIPWALGEYPPELWEEWEQQPGQRWRARAQPHRQQLFLRPPSSDDEIPF